jgi:hypothetical protein
VLSVGPQRPTNSPRGVISFLPPGASSAGGGPASPTQLALEAVEAWASRIRIGRRAARGERDGILVRVLWNATRPAGGYLSGRHRPPLKADVGVSRVRTRHKCKPCQGQGRNHVSGRCDHQSGSICAGGRPAGARLVDDRRVRPCADWPAWYWRTPLGRMTMTRSAVCLRRLRPRRSCYQL